MKTEKFIKGVWLNKVNNNFITSLVLNVSNHKIFILVGFASVLVISIIIWTISSISNVIISGGSTSVSQVMAHITEQYKRDNKEDILYNSLGSAAALVGVKNGSYAFGFLSKDINSTPEVGDNRFNAQQLWTDYRTIRFVFARDYIILIYHLPNGCQINPQQDSLNFKSFFGGKGTELIRKIYTNSNFTWQQAFGTQLICSSDIGNNFFTITRESGSGTRHFFESTIIKSKNYITNQVDSSNGSMYQTISTTPGSIGYISFSYIKRIINNKYLGSKSIASVFGKENYKPEPPYKVVDNNYEFNPVYSLTRPFTGIINYEGKQFISALAFIAWIIDPLPYSKTKSKLWNGKDNPYYDQYFILNSHHAAYWYIKEGEEPLSFDDIFFQKYNNNTTFAKNININNHEKIIWNFKSDYKSIWDVIVEKFPKKYQAYFEYEYNEMEN